MMNDTLFAIEGLNKTTNVMGQFADCSKIQLEYCDSLSGGIDQAILFMGIGLVVQILRKPLNWIGSKYAPFCVISNYVEGSMLPELLILVSFIFLAYLRLTGV